MDEAALHDGVMAEGALAPPRRRRDVWPLWMMVAAALVLPVAILGAGAWGAWHLTWTDTNRDLLRSAEINADHVRRTVERLAETAARIAAGTPAGPLSAEARDALRDRVLDMAIQQPILRAVLVRDAEGQEVLRMNLPPLPGGSIAPSGGGTLPALALGGPGRIIIGRPYRQGDTALLPVGLRVGVAGPAVIFQLDTHDIAAALARHTDSEEDSVLLLRGDGQVLARQPPFLDPPPPIGPDRALMRDIAAGRANGTLTTVSPDADHPVAIAYTRVPGVPDLVVAVGRRNGDILDRWRQAMLPLLLIGLPAAFALMGLAFVVRRQQDALQATLNGLEQRIAERTASLREGEGRLRLAVEAGQLGTWETEVHTGLSTRSPRTVEILGFRPDAATSSASEWQSRIHSGDRARVTEQWEGLLTGLQASYKVEYRFHRGDGAWRWIESSGAVVRADPATGRPTRVAGTIQDITDRRDAEDRRDLLTQEVNHRARNALAIVQAILRLTRASSAAEFAVLVEGRVAALARAQSLLAAELWTGAPLATLITDEITPFGGVAQAGQPGDARIRLDGPAFRIRAEAVQALGMMFHELATNAAKHGALSVPDGQVTVAWAVDEGDGLLRIRWTEQGGPPPGFPTRRGVGSRVIEATVTGQLGGTVERRWPEEGLICDIAVPLARTRAGPG